MAVGQIYQHQATGEWLRAGGVLLGGSPPPAGNQPTGPGITRIQDLFVSGDTHTQTVNRLSAPSAVSYPAGLTELTDFADGSGNSAYGTLLPSKVLGQLGAGSSYTFFQIKPGSSTKAGTLPHTDGSTTNGLYVIRTAPNITGYVASGFTIVGTEQPVDPVKGKPHTYNGIRYDLCTNPRVTDVKTIGIPGYANVNPGETFGQNFQGCTGVLGTDLEGDGRIGVGVASYYTPTFYSAGDRVGSAPIGFNSSNTVELVRPYVHHSLASMMTFWQTDNIITRDGRFEHNGTGTSGNHLSAHGINHERCGGTIDHYNPNIIIDYAASTGGNNGLHISFLSDQDNIDTMQIHNPTWDHIAGTPLRNCLGVQMKQLGAAYQSGTSTQAFPPHVFDAAGVEFDQVSGNPLVGTPDPTHQFIYFQ